MKYKNTFNSGYSKEKIPNPLSNEELMQCFERVDEPEIKDKILLHNLRLVFSIAKKYEDSYLEADDLIDIGIIGLIKAINGFDPTRGKFSSYAGSCIEKEILAYLKTNKKYKRVILHLDEPISQDNNGESLSLKETLSNPIDIEEEVMDNVMFEELRKAIKRLSRNEQEIITKYFGIDCDCMSLDQIAEELDYKKWNISRIKKIALTKLKNYLEKNDLFYGIPEYNRSQKITEMCYLECSILIAYLLLEQDMNQSQISKNYGISTCIIRSLIDNELKMIDPDKYNAVLEKMKIEDFINRENKKYEKPQLLDYINAIYHLRGRVVMLLKLGYMVDYKFSTQEISNLLNLDIQMVEKLLLDGINDISENLKQLKQYSVYEQLIEEQKHDLKVLRLSQ